MIPSGGQSESIFVVTGQYGNDIREIAVLKVSRKGEFFAFTPYARVSSLDVHTSKHLSGERHLRVRLGENRQPTPETEMQLQPLATFSGVELLMGMSAFAGQFSNLNPSGTNRGEVIPFDLNTAQFRDDAFFVRIYLVEHPTEQQIPVPPNVGPRVIRFIRKTKPAIAIELFQEALS